MRNWLRLVKAMENHGNAEGTETQLGDAEEFLRIALETMTDQERAAFFSHDLVAQFIDREAGVEDLALTCLWCGSDDLATGPQWSARAADGDYEESLTEYFCRDCGQSFWI